MTGLQAGANISGDLKDPARSIPKGTLLALLISAISYAVFVVFAGGAGLRDAPGLANGTVVDCLVNHVTHIKFYHSIDGKKLRLLSSKSIFRPTHSRLANMVCIIHTQLCN